MPKIQYEKGGWPVYDPDAGWKSYGEFQAAALNDQQRIKGLQAKKEMEQMKGDPYAKKAVALLPALGGAVGALIPGAGETGLPEVGGAALGAAAKDYLKSKYPNLFGENPSTLPGQAADIGTDVLTGAAPGLLGMAGKIAGAAGSALPIVGRGVGAAVNAMKNLSPAAKIALGILNQGGVRTAGALAKQPDNQF